MDEDEEDENEEEENDYESEEGGGVNPFFWLALAGIGYLLFRKGARDEIVGGEESVRDVTASRSPIAPPQTAQLTGENRTQLRGLPSGPFTMNVPMTRRELAQQAMEEEPQQEEIQSEQESYEQNGEMETQEEPAPEEEQDWEKI